MPRRIDIPKLEEMLMQGHSQAQCAQFFGVSKSAISQAVSSHLKNLVVPPSPAEAARVQAMEDPMGIIAQLRQNYDQLNQQLTVCFEMSKEAKDGEDVLKLVRLQESTTKLAAEVRKTIASFLDIAVTHQALVQNQQVIQIVLDEIGKLDGRAKLAIIQRLKKIDTQFSG